ncbi:restriction endonuclease subunit S [Vibrio cincinnatiensis]
MVPNGWNSKPLVQLLDKIIDYRGQSVPKATSGIPLITARNVRDGYLDFSNQEYIEKSKFNEWMTRGTPQKGDILFTTEAPLGKACRYPKTGVYGVGQRTVTLRTNNKLDSEFLLYTILSERGQLLIDLRSSGSTAKGIKSSELKKVKITYPESLPEQRKIAQILSTWDKAIATTEKLIDASKQQKKALMQQLLTGKKRLVDPETGKAFEGEWERHSLSDLVYVDRKSLGKKTPDNFKFKYISLSNVDFGMISKELEVHEFSTAPSRARRVLQDGDILMSTVRPNLKGFAKVTSCYADCIASTGFAVLTPKKKVSGDYIYQYIFSAHVTGQIDSLVVGSNYPAINSSDVSGLKVYCPAFEEQQKIASVLTAADKEIEFLEAKLAHLKEEKKALMQQLLTGKRRVKVSETEAA